MELLYFSAAGRRFGTADNLVNLVRHSVEIGLLALVMTPIILTGGIDLSVGSMLGLCAVLFGKLWRDAGLSPWAAGLGTLGLGALCGGLNAWLIVWLRLPSLIVTLGTYSLFRGFAEALTQGTDAFTNFPASFLFLGTGRIAGLPAQAWILLAAAGGVWLLVHQTTFGRSIRAIGFAPEGARYAGLPVERHVALAYVLAGFVAALASLTYTARLGTAKADAGLGYELFAITAVVLGGTSIFGGTGSVPGALLGVAAIAVLSNGLSRVPGLMNTASELSGMLTGALLLLALAGGQWPKYLAAWRAHRHTGANAIDSAMKRLVSLLMLATIALVSGCAKSSDTPDSTGQGSHRRITVALMPKSKGNAYFVSCKQGADMAAKELGVELIFDGPTTPDPGKQNEIIENWITLGVDVIAAACENREGISTALRKAREKGIKVLTYDSDAAPDARAWFVNQATPAGIGVALMDEAARLCADEGQFAIITASLTAANMNDWQKYIEARRAARFPRMKMVALRPCDDLKDKAQAEATTLLGAYPELKLLMAICSPAVPGAAEAVKQAGKTGQVKVIGLGLPSENRKYVKEGVTQSVILWKTTDLGYLTVHAAKALAEGRLNPGATTYSAGRLGPIEIQGDNLLLGRPFTFNKDNIDQFDF